MHFKVKCKADAPFIKTAAPHFFLTQLLSARVLGHPEVQQDPLEGTWDMGK